MTALEKFEEYKEYLERKGWKITFDLQSSLTGAFAIHITNEEIHFVSPVYPQEEAPLDEIYIFSRGTLSTFVKQKDFNKIVFILSNSDTIIKEFMETLPKEER